ncbi:MAG: hypothetical protein M1828_006426 [Chrysothrix sp. TS-e1954]|nr:MAG: hypothetical protein M1828_006426 [Chrysothrix sp. TS-e1954]
MPPSESARHESSALGTTEPLEDTKDQEAGIDSPGNSKEEGSIAGKEPTSPRPRSEEAGVSGSSPVGQTTRDESQKGSDNQEDMSRDKHISASDERPTFEAATSRPQTADNKELGEADAITQGMHKIEMTDETTEDEHREPQSFADQDRRPSHRQNNALGVAEEAQPPSDTEFDPQPRNEEASKPEIQTIMTQFKDTPNDQTEVPATPSTLPVFQYPPRTSSLEHATATKPAISSSSHINSAPATTASPSTPSDPEKASLALTYTQSNNSIAQPPLPDPDPEPDLPFDFHRFLEQLRHRTADPVAKFLRSFLQEFGKKQWLVHEQVKIISDFLTFIASRMAQCEVWRQVSEAEFDNAREGMEKLVMNRLYTQTFSPDIPPSEPARVRRKGAAPPALAGRRGQHQEDVERDEVLAQKVRIYCWIREEHLDIKPFWEKGRKFLTLAQQEMAKVRSYRAPRDKIICILNCCKVLFGFLRNAQSEQSADAFIPLLIYTVLKARPDHLVSNVQYILRFRNQDKLSGEAGYYMSSLMGAVQFIENLDRTSLTISDEDFEANVEQAVSAIAEKQPVASQPQHPQQHPNAQNFPRRSSSTAALISKKSTPSRPEVTPRHSMEGERASPRRPQHASRSSVGRSSNSIDAGATSDDSEDNAAVAGFLRTIQKPLNSIGRIFSDDNSQTQMMDHPVATPQPGKANVPRSNLTAAEQSAISAHNVPPGAVAAATLDQQQVHQQQVKHQLAAEDAAARQASAETLQVDRARRAEHATVVETLKGMFPGLDDEVIADVVRMKDGRVGLAVDACLALSR